MEAVGRRCGQVVLLRSPFIVMVSLIGGEDEERLTAEVGQGPSDISLGAALQFVGLLVVPARGEAAEFVHIEHGDDNQHEEPERGMEDIAAELAGSCVVGRPARPASVLTLGMLSSRTARDSVVLEQSPGRVT
jgi:hypothetical protein